MTTFVLPSSFAPRSLPLKLRATQSFNTSNSFSFGLLPSELRRHVYEYTAIQGSPTAQSLALVCREFFAFFFPLVHHDLVLEAEWHEIPLIGTVHAPADAATFPQLVGTIAEHPLVLPCVRKLTLSGPRPPIRMQWALSGITLGDPLLSCCDLGDFLQLCPAVDDLTICGIIWNGCHSLSETCCLTKIARRTFKRLEIRDCENLMVTSHPFYAVEVATSIDTLVLGYQEDWVDNVPSLHDTPVRALHLETIGPTERYQFDVLSTARNGTLEEISLQGVSVHDVFDVALLLTGHTASLKKLSIGFLDGTEGQ